MTRYSGYVAMAPQAEKARADQVQNSAGGFVFALDKWARLDRFLILGTEGGTYYATEGKLARENAVCVQECLVEDGPRLVRRVAEISDAGRAPKNDPAIFVLALACGAKDTPTRAAALAAIPRVCRIGTHLFHFAEDVEKCRRWGRGLRTAVARWYTERSLSSLALQAVKYQQRDGWSHRDLLRLSHPTPKSPSQEAAFRWMVGGKEALGKEGKRGKPIAEGLLPALIVGFEAAHAATTAAEVAGIIRTYALPREAVPTRWLNEPVVWDALLVDMGPMAAIRNLGKMTAIGVVAPLSDGAKRVAALLGGEQLRQARVHPISVLLAQCVYRQGRGEKGKLTWAPGPAMVDALDAAFYEAFGNVEPTGKKHLLGIDVSGSMGCGPIAGAPGLTPRVGAAAMAMVTARTEPEWHAMGFSTRFVDLGISPRMRLDEVVRRMAGLPFQGTDCALPMVWARENRVEVDAFVVYTDNETWAGVHPYQALREYRRVMGRPSRSVVVGMTATNFTIADPADAGMLDVVGFDAAAPQLMADFVKGGC
jgi:60 kDa SS-A/Ro ribonucleoprotein